MSAIQMKRNTASNQKVDLGVVDDFDRYHVEFRHIYELIRDQKYEEAIEQLVDESLKIRIKFRNFPNHVWYCLGSIYFRTEQFSESIKYYINAVRENPEDLQAWFALGNSYAENRQHREAASCFFFVLTVNPKYNGALFNYAGAFMDIGDYEKALFILKKIGSKDKKVIANMELCRSKLTLR